MQGKGRYRLDSSTLDKHGVLVALIVLVIHRIANLLRRSEEIEASQSLSSGSGLLQASPRFAPGSFPMFRGWDPANWRLLASPGAF
jgi:hypothetical protein